MPTPIRKVVISEFGDYSKVKIVNDTLPDPPAGHVQIKILYAGFAGPDIAMRCGVYPFQKKAPFTPGYSAAGIVQANGPNCKRFQTGELVVCLSVYEAEATLANFPEKYLIPVPPGIDATQATPLVLDWSSAYGIVHRSAHVQQGQRVFIHGMSGAVGRALLTLCQLAGAEVYGTASERNHVALRKLGATPFVYTDKNWITEMKALGGADAVFDPLGFESFDESYSILSKHGVLVGYGGNLPTLNGQPPRTQIWPAIKLLLRNLMLGSGKKTRFFYISRDQSTFVPELETLFRMVREGKITVPIKRVFSLDEVPIAHRDWTKLTGMGSVLVKM